MRKLLILLLSLLLPIYVMGQAQINTKKIKIADFTQKTTKIVLTGNLFYDSALQNEIATRWRISPYEFCTLDEFESLKTNDSYYFFLTAKGQFKREKEPGLTFLTIVKGGAHAENGIDGMLEVVSFPIAAAEDPSGREFIFLTAVIDIIQNHIYDSMEKDFDAYGGLGTYTLDLPQTTEMTIIFSEDDLAAMDETARDLYFNDTMMMTDEESADSLLVRNAENTLISYTVAPSRPVQGSFCYKMLIDTQNHRLYYFKRHRITPRNGKGFLLEDIKRISVFRTKKQQTGI